MNTLTKNAAGMPVYACPPLYLWPHILGSFFVRGTMIYCGIACLHMSFLDGSNADKPISHEHHVNLCTPQLGAVDAFAGRSGSMV